MSGKKKDVSSTKIGVSIDECMKYTVELMQFGGVEWLALRIGEIWEKHTKPDEKLTQKEKFVIGLRYPEFLATVDTDEGQCRAVEKQLICLNKLGLSWQMLSDACLRYAGLR